MHYVDSSLRQYLYSRIIENIKEVHPDKPERHSFDYSQVSLAGLHMSLAAWVKTRRRHERIMAMPDRSHEYSLLP